MSTSGCESQSVHHAFSQRIAPHVFDHEGGGGGDQDLPRPNFFGAGSHFKELQTWLTSKLRPFLSIEATRSPAQLLSKLERVTNDTVGSRKFAVFVAVLDGSFEYCVEAFRRHRHNCVLPEAVAESKDLFFFEIVASEIRFHGGRLLEVGAQTTGDHRLFQDGAAAVFISDDEYSATEKALLASMSVHRKLKSRNEEACCDWRERTHCRSVVAESWNQAVRNLRLVNREETFVESAWAHEIPGNILSLLIAAGIRVCAATDELSGTAEAQIRSIVAGGAFK